MIRALTTSGCVARERRYSSMNSSESGCPLSSSMAWASDMGAGTSSSTLRSGLYHRIVSVIGAPHLRWGLRLSLALAWRRTEHREVLRDLLRGAEPRSRGRGLYSPSCLEGSHSRKPGVPTSSTYLNRLGRNCP